MSQLSQLSSPLPSSGVPAPAFSSPRRTQDSDQRDAYNAFRRAADPLAFDNDDVRGPGEAEEEGNGNNTTGRRRGRARNQGTLVRDVPSVKDRTGEAVLQHFEDFVVQYTEAIELPATPSGEEMDADPQTAQAYIQQIKSMAANDHPTLYVDFSHVFSRDETLARAITEQYYRFLPYLRRAVANQVQVHAPKYVYLNSHTNSTVSSGLLTREFAIAFYNLPLVSSIRDLRTHRIGTLMSVSGTVTRTSEVRPELIYGAFECANCGGLVNEVEQQFKYTEPLICPNPTCGNRKAWQLKVEQSRFSDWQKVRIQENPNDIPTGSMPRSLDVILRGDLVERAKAGDKSIFTGTFIVIPDVSQLGLPGVNSEMQREAARGAASGAGNTGVTGLKSLGVRDLQYKTAFLACMVQDADARNTGANIRGEETDDNSQEDQEAFISTLTIPEIEELKMMVHSDYIYNRLVQSIAPTIYGHEIVKKGLLLQLLGGVHKVTREGMNLRGDLNICIVGDPSTSKSQFLKYICSFLPRAVYTSGKASSAAGLTAAVVKDEETGEFTIEAGALMLADNGICAIDEFDKMDISDQVAIHEAMEQQTISIAKAGIHATLNARTSILAAANPIGGRYNRKLSLRTNLGGVMSAPIMSRFDLFFVVLDECNPNVDENIARHIVNVHRFRSEAVQPEFSTAALQRYIRYARTFNPKLTPDASDVLVEKYRLLRQDDSSGVGKNSYRITVRQLESMIRLSEAIARANCTDHITPAFVREAYSLLRQSIIHVEQDDIDFDEEELQGQRPHQGTNVQMPSSGGIFGEEDEVEFNLVSDITAEDLAALNEAESSYTNNEESMVAQHGTPTGRTTGAGSSSSVPPGGRSTAGPSSTPAPAPPPPKKQKMKLPYEQYMAMQALILDHLAGLERTTGKGLNREDLIDWYLEQKEEEIANLDELETQKQLIRRVLNKLVKDNLLIAFQGDVQNSLPSDDQMQVDLDDNIHYMIHPSVDPDVLSSTQ